MTQLIGLRTAQDRQTEAPKMETELGIDQFKSVFRNYPAGVSVITADPGTGPVALTASSLFSISASPPLLGFSVSDLSSVAEALGRAEYVVIHILGAAQVELAQRCSASAAQRFADTSTWTRLVTGEPYFPAADTWVRARVVQRHKAGSATVMIVHAISAKEAPTPTFRHRLPDPLVYHDRNWHRLGGHSVVRSADAEAPDLQSWPDGAFW